MPATKTADGTIHLQTIGTCPAIRTEDITIGTVLVWNGGAQAVVENIERVSPCFFAVTERYTNGTVFTRRLKRGRLVGYRPAA